MNKAEFEALIKDLEGELGLLKSRYEQWIQGIERVPPARQKDRLERRLRDLRREQPNNTAMRYRFQAVFARWTTMNTYWQRVTRQIEEGTFRRDVKKAQQNHKKIEAQKKRESRPAVVLDQPLELDLDVDFDSEIGAALAALEEVPSKRFGPPPAPAPPATPRAVRSPAYPPPPPGAAAPPPPPPPMTGRPVLAPPVPIAPPVPLSRQPGRHVPTSPTAPASRTAPTVSPRPLGRPAPRPSAPPQPGRFPPQQQPGRAPPSLSERDLQHVYDRYVDAKRQNNERVDNLSREKLAKKIRAMEPKLRQKYGSANVDFEVVVKDGRVGLKPKKKK